MLTCPYDKKLYKNEAGLSMHLRKAHPKMWKGDLKNSIPPGFDLGKAEGKNSALARKGQKKARIHADCPFCDYHSDHPPGLAHHIRANHKDEWKGNLRETLGHTTTGRPVTVRKAGSGRQPLSLEQLGGDKVKARMLQQKREYNARIRARFIAQGLTSAGKQRKRKPYGRPVMTSEENRIPIGELPLDCPICHRPYSSRMSLGAHVRHKHHKSLFDLPPYNMKGIKADPFDDRGSLEEFASRTRAAEQTQAEEWPDDKVVITIQNGTTNVVGRDLQSIKELIKQLER